MTMRDKIAAVVSQREAEYAAIHNRPPTPIEYADAIIAAMPSMVKPLEWDDYPINGEPVLSMAKAANGTYFICDDTDDFTGLYCEFISCKDQTWFGTVKPSTAVICSNIHDDDTTPLKEAANTHHVAQVLSSFNGAKTPTYPT